MTYLDDVHFQSLLFQASGEAEYVSTMADQPDQLYIQFVLSTVGNATIADMDASEALVRVEFVCHGTWEFCSININFTLLFFLLRCYALISQLQYATNKRN